MCLPAQRCSGNVKHYLLSQSVTSASPLLSNLRKYSPGKEKSFRKKEENLIFKSRECWLDLAVSEKYQLPYKLVEAGFVLSLRLLKSTLNPRVSSFLICEFFRCQPAMKRKIPRKRKTLSFERQKNMNFKC